MGILWSLEHFRYYVHGIKLRLLVTETSRNRKKKENRGKIGLSPSQTFAKKRKPVTPLSQ